MLNADDGFKAAMADRGIFLYLGLTLLLIGGALLIYRKFKVNNVDKEIEESNVVSKLDESLKEIELRTLNIKDGDINVDEHVQKTSVFLLILRRFLNVLWYLIGTNNK